MSNGGRLEDIVGERASALALALGEGVVEEGHSMMAGIEERRKEHNSPHMDSLCAFFYTCEWTIVAQLCFM